MIEVEALGTRELTKVFPSTCTEFLAIIDGLGRSTYFDEETLTGDNQFLNNVLNDSFIPSSVSVVGCMTKKFESWTEQRILYRISKEAENSEYLGDSLSYLGKWISRLNCDNCGIQDVSVIEPDGYYILIYGIEED